MQKLGKVACFMMPFLEMMAILVNSIFMVCITCNRYMAVVRIDKGSSEPTKVFSTTCCSMILGFSAAVSSPFFTSYDYLLYYVVPVPDPEEDHPVATYYIGYICRSDLVRKTSCD